MFFGMSLETFSIVCIVLSGIGAMATLVVALRFNPDKTKLKITTARK